MNIESIKEDTELNADYQRALGEARFMAVRAGIPAEVVAGSPVEVDIPEDEWVIVWGCTAAQAQALTPNGEDWYEYFAEQQPAKDVFTWKGCPRWSIWTPCRVW